jgi:hypothetical protein
MRDLNVKDSAGIVSILAIVVAVSGGCSTGSGSANVTGTGGGSTGTPGTGGTTGTGGAGVTGTGGSAAIGTGGSGPSVPSVCDGTATRILALDQGKVDNFEDASLSPGWSPFNDVMPTPNSFKMIQESGGAISTAHFGHYAGTGARTPVMGGYGVGVIYNVAIDQTAGIYCIDISAFDGVTFWARAATAGAKVGLNFVVPQTNAKVDGGDCMTGCFLHPSRTITLTTQWAQYSVTFAEASGGTARVTNRLQELGWLSPDSNWDFSLDEIQFYKGTPPTTPVAP